MVTEKEIKDWYNRRYAQGGSEAMRPLEAYRFFIDCLDTRPGGRILDIACGTGYLLKTADMAGLETWGIDISDEAVRIAEKNSPSSKIKVGRGEELDFPDDYFDHVTCLGSLEHFLDMQKALKEMQRVSKKDAQFIIVVPNVDFLSWKFSASKGTEQQEINENLMSLAQWKDIFIKAGFEITDIKQDKWFMNQYAIFASYNPLGIARRILKKLYWALLPLKYTYQFVFILRKPSG